MAIEMHIFKQQERAYNGIEVSGACLEITREIRGRLILQET